MTAIDLDNPPDGCRPYVELYERAKDRASAAEQEVERLRTCISERERTHKTRIAAAFEENRTLGAELYREQGRSAVLEADNARLRAALESLLSWFGDAHSVDPDDDHHAAVCVCHEVGKARAAMSPEASTHTKESP